MRAEEKGTGKSQQITITNDKGRLSKDDIERMVSDAAKFESADKDQRDRVEARSELENYAFSMRNTIDDVGDKMNMADKEVIAKACVFAMNWLNANQEGSKDEYQHRKRELEGVCNPIMTKMYQGAYTNTAGRRK